MHAVSLRPAATAEHFHAQTAIGLFAQGGEWSDQKTHIRPGRIFLKCARTQQQSESASLLRRQLQPPEGTIGETSHSSQDRGHAGTAQGLIDRP